MAFVRFGSIVHCTTCKTMGCCLILDYRDSITGIFYYYCNADQKKRGYYEFKFHCITKVTLMEFRRWELSPSKMLQVPKLRIREFLWIPLFRTLIYNTYFLGWRNTHTKWFLSQKSWLSIKISAFKKSGALLESLVHLKKKKKGILEWGKGEGRKFVCLANLKQTNHQLFFQQKNYSGSAENCDLGSTTMMRHVEIPKEWRGPLFHRGKRKWGGSRAHGFPSLSCDCLSLAEFLVRQEEGVDLLPVGLCYCGRVGKLWLYLTDVLLIFIP